MKDPWFKFFPSDWLAGTSGLTPAERGVYITLLALIYENGGPIELDRPRLARRCGMPAGSFVRVLDALVDAKKLTVIDGCAISNRRAEHELGERENVRTKQQSGARQTNAILAEKRQQNQHDDERTPSRLANAIPEARYQKEKKEPPNPQGGRRRRRASGFIEPDLSTTSAFDEFWQVYPRKVGKLAAKDLFQRYSAEHQRVLIEAAKRFAADMAKERRDPTKIPHPKTWLNPERGGFGDYVKGPTNGADRRTGDEHRGADAPRTEDGPAGHDERVLRGGESLRGVPGGDGPVECAAPGGREGVGGLGGLPAPLGAGHAEPHHIRAGGVEHPRRDDLDANPLALGDDGHSGGRPAWVH